MAKSHHTNDLPDYAYLDPQKGVHMSGWESHPAMIPRTLATSEHLSPAEKVVGLHVHTVMDNMQFGGDIYERFDSDQNSIELGMSKSDYETALFNLHDAGYVEIIGRDKPASPTRRDLDENELLDISRKFHAAKYIAQQERMEQEQLNQKPSNSRKTISAELRLLVYKADGYQCINCGTNESLTVDHIRPIVRGGTNDLDNLQTMCQPCNSTKGAKTMDEFVEWIESKGAEGSFF